MKIILNGNSSDVRADESVLAAMLYGSFATGEADAYFDVECALFFDTSVFPSINKREWVEQIAPVLLFFADDFGHFTAIFDNFIRAEFHFDAADKIADVSAWKRNAWFRCLQKRLFCCCCVYGLNPLRPDISRSRFRTTGSV